MEQVNACPNNDLDARRGSDGPRAGRLDWRHWVAACLALCAMGVTMIYSTAGGSRATGHLYITQLYALVLGLAAMVFTLTVDYRTFTDKSHLIYIALLAVRGEITS